MNKRLNEINAKRGLFIIEILLIVFMILLMQCSVLINSVNAETITETYGNISWSYDTETKTLTFSGNGEITKDWYGDNDNEFTKKVKKIVIHDGITEIGDLAFYPCVNVENIEIPKSVINIDDWGLYPLNNLKNINVSEDNSEFCSIDGILYNKNITKLVMYPERKDSTTYEILDGINSFSKYALCSVGDNVENITVSENNKNFKSIDGVLFNIDGTQLIRYPIGKKEKNYEIPEGTKTIKENAFEGSNLENIEITDGVEIIEEEAFSYCSKLTNVEIPKTVGSIEVAAFYNCRNLTTVKLPNTMSELGKNVFAYCQKLTEINIPNGISKLKDSVFAYTGLTQVEIPNTVKEIGNTTFYQCTNLSKVKMSDSVTEIGAYAFGDCTSLKSLEMPNTIKSIGQDAFNNCTELTNINLPNSIEYIGVGAFWGCTKLESVNIPHNSNLTDLFGFGETGLRYIEIPSNIKKIHSNAFKNCINLTTVEIQNGVSEIQGNAFEGCTNLTKIIIPKSVLDMGKFASGRTVFEGCDNVTIYCQSNSKALEHAMEKNIKYVIDDDVPQIENVKIDGAYITITSNDSKVGLDKYPYSIDGQHWFSNNSIAVEKSGTYTVYVRDKLGNIAIKDDVEVEIKNENDNSDNNKENNEQNQTKGDVTAPVIKDIQVNGFNIKIIAEDSESGLAEEAYSLDNKTWQSNNEIKVEKDGQYMVYVKDKEGNIAKKLVVIEPEEENSNKSNSKNDNENTNKTTKGTNNVEDKTVTSAKKLPQTGANLFIPVVLITVASIFTISYKKFKNIKLK